MPLNKEIRRVLVIASGPIVIGQAAEFDYAGTQACRALKQQGLEVILINSNPATIMTDNAMADKIYIEPLNLFSIARSYSSILSLGDETAKEMAKLTKGYAYAYQVLGYLYYESASKNKGKVDHSELIRSFETTLSEYVYEKIWFGLPDTEKNILTLLVKNGQMKIKDIRGELSLTDSQMSVYRDRLKRRGLVDATSYGLLSLSLPRFAEIVSFWVD